MQKTVCLIVILLLSLTYLSACGQKGPLFLPGDPSQIQTVPPTGQDQTDSDEDNGNEDNEDEEKPITNRTNRRG